MYLLQPDGNPATEPIRFKGLDADRWYRVTFEDGSHPTSVMSGRALMENGLQVLLDGPEASELIFFEAAE